MRVMDSAGHNDGVTAPASAKPPKTSRARMTGRERREQLIGVGRKHFADKGFEGTTIEEIAAVEGTSIATVKRQWRVARTWLQNALE